MKDERKFEVEVAPGERAPGTAGAAASSVVALAAVVDAHRLPGSHPLPLPPRLGSAWRWSC